MIARFVSTEDLQKALDITNERFHGNLRFKYGTPEPRGNRLKFGLTVHNSRAPGSRVSASWGNSGRRLSAACWHAHGHFFDALFSIVPEAVVRVSNRKITAEEGNWIDWTIGPPICPIQYSEACDCNTGEVDGLAHYPEGYTEKRAI